MVLLLNCHLLAAVEVHNTRVGMGSSKFHDSTGVVLAGATAGHSKDIHKPARHHLDTHGMVGCSCNQVDDARCW